MLPFSIAGTGIEGLLDSIGVSSSIPEDKTDKPDSVCICPVNNGVPPGCAPDFPTFGISLNYWSGFEIIETTKEPYCFITINIEKEMDTDLVPQKGSQSSKGESEHSFWHLHQYFMPVFKIIDLLGNMLCTPRYRNIAMALEGNPFSLAYMTELDPMWDDDILTNILNPESIIFGNIAAQAACVADCVSATSGYPIDALFWCAGCHGNIYPLDGNISGDYGGVQSSTLAVERFAAKMHRELSYWSFSGKATMCRPLPQPIIKKSQYRTQMTYPVAMNKGGWATGCQPFGRSTVLYESFKEIPISGENFSYLLWRRKSCCMTVPSACEP
jgi:conjugal transfer pilus assembly protein TraU